MLRILLVMGVGDWVIEIIFSPAGMCRFTSNVDNLMGISEPGRFGRWYRVRRLQSGGETTTIYHFIYTMHLATTTPRAIAYNGAIVIARLTGDKQ
jgi:hypothetical protein